MTALYRGYDREALDRQLNLRARWPEHQDYFKRWAEDSHEVRTRLPAYIDLAYGASPGERLDLFPVRGVERPTPLVAFIHGGYWQSLDKGDYSYLAPTFLEAGIAFASLNYDLAPKARIPEMVGEVRRALLWLQSESPRFGIDPQRIVLVGHSAGGHLATSALMADWAALGLDEAPFSAVLSLSGVYDLEPLRLSYHQPVLMLDGTAVREMSPLRNAPKAMRPLTLAVGGDETQEFLDQQAELAESWGKAGVEIAIVDLPGEHHFSVVDLLGRAEHPLFRELCRLCGV